jgi:hypothetical protein
MSFLDGLKDVVSDAGDIADSVSGIVNTVRGAPTLSTVQTKATASVPYQYPGDVAGRTEQIGTPLKTDITPYVFMFGIGLAAIIFIRRT